MALWRLRGEHSRDEPFPTILRPHDQDRAWVGDVRPVVDRGRRRTTDTGNEGVMVAHAARTPISAKRYDAVEGIVNELRPLTELVEVHLPVGTRGRGRELAHEILLRRTNATPVESVVHR